MDVHGDSKNQLKPVCSTQKFSQKERPENLICDHILRKHCDYWWLTHSTVTITALIPQHHMQLLGNVFRCTLSEFATDYVSETKKRTNKKTLRKPQKQTTTKKLISCKNSKIKGFLHKQTDQNFGIKVISILFIYSVGQTLPPHPAKDSCQALDKSLAAISMTWLA